MDELLKCLENIKTDEDETNEKREIAEYLARRFNVEDSHYMYFIMTKYRKIYDIDSYEKLLKSNKIQSDDACVYVKHNYLSEYDPVKYFYPFLIDRYLLPFAYLSKLGFSSVYAVPALGLKYVSMVVHFPNIGRIVVEVADIDTATINTNLPTIVRNISTKRISVATERIASQLVSEKLFAGHDYYKALSILYRYYENHDTSLAKEVEAIKDAYNRIFQPYRVVYDLKTKQFIPT
jgi:midasin (ATPase involved in ribosome maturation)